MAPSFIGFFFSNYICLKMNWLIPSRDFWFVTFSTCGLFGWHMDFEERGNTNSMTGGWGFRSRGKTLSLIPSGPPHKKNPNHYDCLLRPLSQKACQFRTLTVKICKGSFGSRLWKRCRQLDHLVTNTYWTCPFPLPSDQPCQQLFT